MQVTIKWNGLKDRSLTSYHGAITQSVEYQGKIQLKATLLIDDISIEASLADFVEQILRPLYEALISSLYQANGTTKLRKCV